MVMISNMCYLNSLPSFLLKKTTSLSGLLSTATHIAPFSCEATTRPEVDCFIPFKKGCHENGWWKAILSETS